jgi:hypothetical protein
MVQAETKKKELQSQYPLLRLLEYLKEVLFNLCFTTNEYYRYKGKTIKRLNKDLLAVSQ